MFQLHTDKRFRIRLLCALAGMWGVTTGFAVFVLISQRMREEAGFPAAIHFLAVLAVAVIVVAITEWFRDTIRGEKSETFRSLSAILTSVLLLAVFEVCVLAYEDVSQATFESPYALKEIAARVSGKEIPYQFFGLQDLRDPRGLLARLRLGYDDLQAKRTSPEASVVSELGAEMQWTLLPDAAPKPASHDALVSIVQAKLSDCARLQNLTSIFESPNALDDCETKLGAPGLPATANESEYNRLIEKLRVLRGQDDGEMHYFSSELLPHSDFDLADMFGHLYEGPPTARLNTAPCNTDDPKCPLRRMPDVSALADMTAHDVWSDERLRELLTVELNRILLSPELYHDSAFHFVNAPEALKQSLGQNEEDISDHDALVGELARLSAQKEAEGTDEKIATTQSELELVESRLLPPAELVQRNRQLLVASFPEFLVPAKESFDQKNADLIVLALLWMLAAGALGWTLARTIFDEPGPGTQMVRRGAVRGLAAAFKAAPLLVVAYVLVLRLGTLIHDVLRFPYELHYMWDFSGHLPEDLLDSTLIPTTLRFSGYWAHKWTMLAVTFGALAALCAFWQIDGARRGMATARRWQWFAVSAAAMLVFGLVFDVNILYIYLLVGLVWVTPAVFLGVWGPYLRTGSSVPQTWGWISMLAGIILIFLTALRLHWSAIPSWLWAPGTLLIGLGMAVRAQRRLEEYWPLVALALGLTVCGMAALVQRVTFVGVLSDVHELNAYGGYEAKLWPDFRQPAAPHQLVVSWFDDFLSYERQPRSREDELRSQFDLWRDNLRSEASGAGATGDASLDAELISSEKQLRRTRQDVTQWLELSIVGSVGFWLSVGLLAGWAMRSNTESKGSTHTA